MNFVMNRGMGFVSGSSFQNLTIASVTLKVSNAASYYFLTNSSINLTDYLNCYATLTDTGGKAKKVQLGAAGTGETLGSELITTAWTNNAAGVYESFASTGGGNLTAENSAGLGYATSTAFNVTAGTLLKFTDTFNLVSGSVNKISSLVAALGAPEVIYVSSPTTGSYAVYGTEPTGSRVLLYYCNAAGSFAATGISLKPVLTPDTTGCWFTPISEDSGWLPNSATYTLLLTRS